MEKPHCSVNFDGNNEESPYARPICGFGTKGELPGFAGRAEREELGCFPVSCRFRVRCRERDNIRPRSAVLTPNHTSDLLADQHHDQTSTKHDRTSEDSNLIICELGCKLHGRLAPIASGWKCGNATSTPIGHSHRDVPVRDFLTFVCDNEWPSLRQFETSQLGTNSGRVST